jgi:acetyl esterase
MPVDPVVQQVLDEIAKLDAPSFESMTPEQARAIPRLRMGTPEAVARIEDRTVPGPDGAIPVRVYQPAGEPPSPLLVYFHGGGWVIGSLDSHDVTCRALANASGCVVVSIGYRLAPEHKFPAPAEDCYAATRYVADHAAEFGGDPSRLAVGGDSAGGNLAAAVTLMVRERGGPRVTFQLLIYPVTDFRFDTPSYSDNATGYLLTTAAMRWFWNHYLRDAADGGSPFASPMRAADLHGLPAALLITAEYDPLRDEGEAYAARLRDAGVAAVTSRYDGQIHGFVAMAGVFPAARRAIDEAAAALRAALGISTAVIG